MPGPAALRPAVIAVSLADATAHTAPLGGTWHRLLIGRDGPLDVAAMPCPTVRVTDAAMHTDQIAVHELVRALADANPDIEIHLPPPMTVPVAGLADLTDVRADLDRENDELLVRRMVRRIQQRIEDGADALGEYFAAVPPNRRARAAREVGRRRVHTGMTSADALRSVAADYTAGRLS